MAFLIMLICSPIASPAANRARGKSEVLPPNLSLSEGAKRILGRVWERSPTFRDQCRRIAEASWMKIKVRFVAERGRQYAALTTIKKYADGLAVSTMQILITDQHVEAIGHEFEHILEQIEGLNLKEMALKGSVGVYRNGDGSYETERAVSAGRRVYFEYRGAKMARDTEVGS